MVDMSIEIYQYLNVYTMSTLALVGMAIIIYCIRKDKIKTAAVFILATGFILYMIPGVHDFNQQCEVRYVHREVIVIPLRYEGDGIPSYEMDQITITKRDWWSSYLTIESEDETIVVWMPTPLKNSVMKYTENTEIPIVDTVKSELISEINSRLPEGIDIPENIDFEELFNFKKHFERALSPFKSYFR